jgi:adenine-specific DNA-methyltransferase
VRVKQHRSELARRLRAESTDAERLLWRHLRNRNLAGAKFRRQQPIGGYVADFFCAEHRLIVELDGSQHAENPRDRIRDAELTELGYRVIRFWNNDVLQRTASVLARILELLDTPHPASPSRGEE